MTTRKSLLRDSAVCWAERREELRGRSNGATKISQDVAHRLYLLRNASCILVPESFASHDLYRLELQASLPSTLLGAQAALLKLPVRSQPKTTQNIYPDFLSVSPRRGKRVCQVSEAGSPRQKPSSLPPRKNPACCLPPSILTSGNDGAARDLRDCFRGMLGTWQQAELAGKRPGPVAGARLPHRFCGLRRRKGGGALRRC